jgi:aspartate/methionine/tyrosine aminotransferase
MMAPMRIADFALERYFARWEFAVDHLLCASDVQGYPMAELLDLADENTRAMWDGLTLGYTESTGHPLLRAEIASLHEGLGPDDVLVFAGAEEAIFCLANVLLGPGDHAVVTWPGYQSLYEVARATGADVTLHELREEAAWAIDIDALRRQVTSATRLIVVNAPHNPTGMLPDRSTFDAVVALADEVGAYLLVDEVYRFLEFDEAARLPAGADASPRGISLGVMSKSFAMAGLRIGWLATRDRDVARALRAVQGLHDDLLVGAIGGAGAHRSPGTRDRPSAVAPDRRRQPRAASTRSSTPGATASTGCGRVPGPSVSHA